MKRADGWSRVEHHRSINNNVDHAAARTPGANYVRTCDTRYLPDKRQLLRSFIFFFNFWGVFDVFKMFFSDFFVFLLFCVLLFFFMLCVWGGGGYELVISKIN